MIDGIANKGVGPRSTVTSSRTSAPADPSSAKAPKSAESAKSVLASLAQPTAPVDQARIDDLRSRIGDGSYKPDPAAIAKAMIERDVSA